MRRRARLGTVCAARRGLSLVELLVALTVMGIVTSVVSVAVGAAGTEAPLDPAAAAVTSARRTALASGVPTSVMLLVDDTVRAATAFPDGRVVADPVLGVERLSGRTSRGDR